MIACHVEGISILHQPPPPAPLAEVRDADERLQVGIVRPPFENVGDQHGCRYPQRGTCRKREEAPADPRVTPEPADPHPLNQQKDDARRHREPGGARARQQQRGRRDGEPGRAHVGRDPRARVERQVDEQRYADSREVRHEVAIAECTARCPPRRVEREFDTICLQQSGRRAHGDRKGEGRQERARESRTRDSPSGPEEREARPRHAHGAEAKPGIDRAERRDDREQPVADEEEIDERNGETSRLAKGQQRRAERRRVQDEFLGHLISVEVEKRRGNGDEDDQKRAELKHAAWSPHCQRVGQ